LHLREASALAGHISLFLSMWVHARHVLHCTPDPAARPRSRWRIPRPHFRLPALRLPSIGLPARRREANLPIDAQSVVDRPSSKRHPSTKSANAKPAPSGPAADQPAPGRKPNLRLDGSHAPSPERADTRPTSGEAAYHTTETAPVELASLANKDHAEHVPDCEHPDARDSEPNDLLSKPDLRGLSKKQRRKLLQEFRERERAANDG